jgi:hypothetical protein
VYNTYSEWQEQLPWMSERGIRKLISDLEKNGYIVAANHNRARFDQTKWYRIDYARLNVDFSDVSQNVTSSDTKCQTSSHKVSDDATQNVDSDVAQSVRPIPETTKTTTKEAPFDSTLTALPVNENVPPKPAVVGDTPAHVFVNEYYRIVGGAPTNHGKDIGNAKKLLSVGVYATDIPSLVEWARSTWVGKDGFDLASLIPHIGKWRTWKSQPRRKVADASGGIAYG